MMEQHKQIVIKELRDHFSISLQLYHKYNDNSWEKHMDICVFLIAKLKDDTDHLEQLQKELVEKVYSISETKDYSILVV